MLVTGEIKTCLRNYLILAQLTWWSEQKYKRKRRKTHIVFIIVEFEVI